jgi:hypothetical protein
MKLTEKEKKYLKMALRRDKHGLQKSGLLISDDYNALLKKFRLKPIINK